MKHVLILGGTGDARALADRLAATARVTLSLAGRTAHPLEAYGDMRVGGFGGAEGLARWIGQHGVDMLVDATHPFAGRISANARTAAMLADVPLVALERPLWHAVEGDRWIAADDMEAAAALIGEAPRRVFLAVGRQELAPFAAHAQHAYLIRSVEAPDLPPALRGARIIEARGPFAEAGERTLLIEERIEIVVGKNSGGAATYGKIAAARALGLPVVMVRRPRSGAACPVSGVDEALAAIKTGLHAGALPQDRGE